MTKVLQAEPGDNHTLTHTHTKTSALLAQNRLSPQLHALSNPTGRDPSIS